MRGDDEVPHVGVEAEECIGTCLHKTRRELEDATPDDILHNLQDYCESKALQDFCTRHGVNNVQFSWNPRLICRRRLPWRKSKHCKLHDQFWKSYHDHPTLNLALAFHGTAEANVSKILHYGLDPHYRRTQAFGKGEYFAKEPGLSATYGQCLIVFLLLMPEDHEKVYSQKDRDIIVVNNHAHQLPLGVLHFDSVDNHKIQHSQQMRLVQRSLKQTAIEQDWHVQEAKLVHKIATLLQQGRVEQAAHELKQATLYHHLSSPYDQELATLVRDTVVDDTERATLFPSLLSVTPLEEELAADDSRLSVTMLEAEARDAWQEFLTMKLDPNRNFEEDVKVVELPAASSSASCGHRLVPLPSSLPGALVLLEH